MTEELPAQVGEHALAGPPGVEGLRIAEGNAQRTRGDERDDEPAERGRVAVADLVDRATEQVRRQERNRSRAEQGQHHDRGASLVRPGQPVEGLQPELSLY